VVDEFGCHQTWRKWASGMTVVDGVVEMHANPIMEYELSFNLGQ
jgi:hypothetical protein